MVMMKKIVIFLSVMISISALSMEKPVGGSKRGLAELVEAIEQAKVPRAESESESELPSSVTEKLEPVSQDLIAMPETGLQDLPNELLARITSLITNASGNTNDQKLISAAIDINNFAIINKAFREFFKSDYIQLMIIKELAKKYARGDVYAAAFALATDEASGMIGATLNDAIGYNEDESALEITNTYVVSHFQAYLADALKNKKKDAWRFFIKHVTPEKLALIIDSLLIDGEPALLYLVSTDNKEMLSEVLAIEDINYDIADDEGITPLMAAIVARNTDLIHFLIDQDVDVNKVDDNENTALFKAVSVGNLEYVNLLLDENATVNLINDQEYTPLIIAILNANIPIIRRLLEVPGIDVNFVGDQPDFDGRTTSALHYAAQLGNPEIFRILLSVPNIQLNILNSDGQTPLHVAAINNIENIVEQLIRAGAQVNIQDAQGMTPLMYAAREDSPLSVYYLINPPGNADLSLTDAQGHTALWHARNAQKPGNIVILQTAQTPE
jgi:ankyrin repeat protein